MPQYYNPDSGEKVYYDPDTGKQIGTGRAPEPAMAPASSHRLSGAAAQQQSGQVMTDENGRALAIPTMAKGVALDPTTPEGLINNALMMATGIGGSIRAAGGVVPAVRQAIISGAGAVAGAEGGERVGRWVGHPKAGRLVGGLAGAVYGPGALRGLVSRLAGTEETAAAAAGLREATERATAMQAKRLEMEAAKIAERRAAREAATKLGERRAAIAEERNALMKARLEGRAPLNPPRAAAAPQTAPEAPAAAPVAVAPQVATAAEVAPVASHVTAPTGDMAQIIMKIQQAQGTATGRRIVREWLNEQPKELQSQIRLLLARGQSTMPSRFGQSEELSATLARMLGQ